MNSDSTILPTFVVKALGIFGFAWLELNVVVVPHWAWNCVLGRGGSTLQVRFLGVGLNVDVTDIIVTFIITTSPRVTCWQRLWRAHQWVLDINNRVSVDFT